MKFVLLMFCVVIAKTQSENGYGRPYGPYMQQGYTRIKRVKYSNPPSRLYSRPPASIPSKGPFSYTPPPSYMMDNDDPPYHGNSYPGSSRPKVSKRPTNEGLREEDLQNFVKYLSKQDLDKIIEYTGYNRDSERTRDPYERQIDSRPTTDEYRNIYHSIQDSESSLKPQEDDESNMFSAIVHEIDLDPKFNPYQEKNPSFNRLTNDETEYQPKPYDYEKKKYDNDYINLSKYVTVPTPLSYYTSPPNQYNNAVLDTQESMQSHITYSDPSNGVSKVLSEEFLPKPVNLRDDTDYDVAFTNNVPTFVKAGSYRLENFGSLPLMNYDSKLDTLSSYHVPHYTVTASKSLIPNAELTSSYTAPSFSSSSSSVAYEPAPPASAGKEQSDAHLKAVRIWSHRSKGTAYTLHDDGTLSLEKPGKPKGGYGYS